MELSYFAIIIGAIFVNNVVLAQCLGICPFLGVSSKVETSTLPKLLPDCRDLSRFSITTVCCSSAAVSTIT